MVFVYILVTLTLRTGTYVCLRLTSVEKVFFWTMIKPSVFYLTYVTDFFIVAGVMHFIAKSAPLKADKAANISTSIFPQAYDGEHGVQANDHVTESEGSEDGDLIILNRKRAAGSDSD